MRVMPVWFAGDVEAAARFLEALGLAVDTTSRRGGWVELAGTAGSVGVHTARSTEEPHAPGDCALSFASDEPLEQVRHRLFAAGFADAHIIDETFGRSLRVTSPEGTAVQVHEYDAEVWP